MEGGDRVGGTLLHGLWGGDRRPWHSSIAATELDLLSSLTAPFCRSQSLCNALYAESI